MKITSTFNKEDYILIKNNHNFNTITALIHEIAHLKEKRNFASSEDLNNFICGSNKTEINALLEERKFNIFYSANPIFEKDVKECIKGDCYTLRQDIDFIIKEPEYFCQYEEMNFLVY